MDQPQSSGSPEWSINTKRIIGVIAFIVAVVLIYQFRSVIPLIFSAVVLSYLFHPIADWFQETLLRGRLRVVAVLMTFLLIIAIITIVLLVVIPVGVAQIQTLLANTPEFLQDAQDWIIDRLDDEIVLTNTPVGRFFDEPIIVADVLGIEMSDENIITQLFNPNAATVDFDAGIIIRRVTTSVTGSAFSVLGGAFSIGLNVVFLLTMMFYLMTDGKNMINALTRAVPEGYEADFRKMLSELGYVWDSYLRGQVTLSLIMGSAMYILARLLGIPNALFLALFAGLMEFIPNIGPALAMVPAALIALFSQSLTIPALSGIGFALIVVLLWTVLQQTEAAVLIPRIVGDSLNLHPFVVILAVIGGVSVGGIFAVLVAAPLVASARLIAQYIYGKLTGRNPFPENRKTVRQQQRERRPMLMRLGDVCARWVRDLISSRAVTRR